jgi:uncharacterized protein (TIGR03067 family)
MKLLLLGFATVGLVLLVADAADDAARKDTEKLQGTWKLTGVVEPDGKKLGPTEVPDMKLTLEGNKVIQARDGKAINEGTFKIDPTKKPATFDFTDKDGKVLAGIYLLDGDDLKYAVDPAGKERPKDFDAKGIAINIYKREKK